MNAPTPFTAEEIRQGCPPGRTVTTVTTTGGESVTSVTTFLDGNAEGAECDFDGERAFVKWTDLQAHASFPASITTITDETITTELGTHECLRYDVARDGRVDRFWFAKDLPGMPIRTESVGMDGGVLSTSEVVSSV